MEERITDLQPLLGKEKSIYKIIAPENFDSRELGTTVSSDPNGIIGRRIDVPLNYLTEDNTKQHLKVIFEINEIKDDKALTRFKLFRANPGYVHSKVRKGMSKVDYLGDLKLNDSKIKIKIMAVTHHKIQTSHKMDVRSQIADILDKHKNTNLNDFLQATLFGKLGTEIYHNIKHICPTRRVEIEEVRVV